MNGTLDSTEDDDESTFVAIKPALSVIATGPQAPALSPGRASPVEPLLRGRIHSGATKATPDAAVSPTDSPLADKRSATLQPLLRVNSGEVTPSPSAKDSEEEEEEPRISLAAVSRHRRACDVDVEGDGQGEGEPNDEDHDLNDPESDLHPAHRAEALDVSAATELRWALLRERVYVEKMESLAWEEKLVKKAHPEMIHLLGGWLPGYRRLKLAHTKPVHGVANVQERRRDGKHATCSWWECERDPPQTYMVSEANGGRRLDYPDRSMELASPESTTLSTTDAARDLEFLIQSQRRTNYGSREGRHSSYNSPATYHQAPEAQYLIRCLDPANDPARQAV